MAQKGSRVRYAARIFLHRGGEVTRDGEIIAHDTGYLKTTVIDGIELILNPVEIGQRRTIAGIEKSLIGMKSGGYREILVSPHLAYGEKGVPESIPGIALLRTKIWLEKVENTA